MGHERTMISPQDRYRLIWLAAFLSCLFCALIVRFFQIQIVEGEKWKQEALAQHEHILIEPFRRGSFYSNTSVKEGHPEEDQPFVVDIPMFHLHIDPDSIPSHLREPMSAALFSLLKSTPERRHKMRAEFERKSRDRKIAVWLDRQKRKEIETWWNAFHKKEKLARNALFFTPDYKRSYPFGTMLGAVLHTVQWEKDPKTQQSQPTGGLEMLFHSFLNGKPGKRRIIRSPKHPLDTGTVLEAPIHGADIYLTINHYLQAIVESELAKGVQAAKGKGGWAVMMDPYNGEILAIAQTPSFDPARYAEFFNHKELQPYTYVKAVTDCFEPGSIFKPITLAICMRANEELLAAGKRPIFYPEEKISTANGSFPGRSQAIKDGRSHRYLNMELALQKSSNIYMARLVQRLIETMGEEWYRKALHDLFGFGRKTQIELPAETAGLLPTPGKLHPNGKLEWSVPTPFSLAIGYNILANSVQIVRAYAIFANGGFEVQPHLIRKIVQKMPDGTHQILRDNRGYRAKKRVLSKKSVDAIVCAMKFTTKEGGTGKRADIPGYTEAGKSGTAEKIIDGVYSKNNHISSFVGFAPAHNPRFVLIVSIDDPEKKFIPGVGKHQLGGICAGPIFREIATASLHYLGIAPDDPYGYPPGDPRRDSKRADWYDEVAKLKALYEQWNL
ncbi:MAG: penicillin-binding protein 2 [Chlamydiia bacterium]|nr:penicillin-binding protein 2 [Chlamydiia bacterium]